MERLRKRNEIPKKDTWNLGAMYSNDQIWELDYKKAEDLLENFAAEQGTLGQSAAHLKQVLDLYYEVQRKIEKIAVYARQHADEDTTNNQYQQMSIRAQNLMVLAASKTAYLTPEVLSLGKVWLEQALDTNEELRYYSRIIREMLRQNEHILSAQVENLLADAMDLANAPADIFTLLNNADLKFPCIPDGQGNEIEITQGNYVPLLESPDRELRKAVFHALLGTYSRFKNTIAAAYYANVKQAIFFAKARKYSSTRAFYLDDSNIPEKVYDNLIHTIHKHMDVMYRYVNLRRRLLNVEELHMYDVYAPLIEESSRKYTYEEAKEIVLKGLEPLGEEYRDILKEGFTNRWVDVYENEGKRGGAYSWGCYDSHPYVLLNFQGTLDNVFTLAHEMGHSLHSYYSRKYQGYAYADYRIFVAEVASTCNEALLIRCLLKQAKNQKERAYLLNHFLDKFKGTMFRQAMFAEFERETHRIAEEGTPLTAELLCNIYWKLNAQYFGSDMICDKDIAIEWARIPHFYTPFYVYQYATGFAAAIALSNRILKEGQPALEDYKKFLKGGNSRDSIELLKLAGVDMTRPEPVESALELFEELLEELERSV